MKLSKILPLVGLVMFVFIIARSEPAKIFQALMNVNVSYLLLSIGMVFLLIILKGIKWRMIIRMHGCDYSLAKSSKAWLVGAFAGIITPGRVGDLARALYLKRENNNLGRCVSTVIVDRVLELLVILVFSLIGVVFFISWFGQSLYLNVLMAFIILCFVLIALMVRKGVVRKIMKPIFNILVPKRYGEKLRLSFHEFYGSIGEMRKKKTGLLYATIFSAVIWLLSILSTQLFALTLGIYIDFFYLLPVISIMVIIELIPISISGIGTRDAFLVFSLGFIGIAAESAIAFSIIYLILGYWLNALAGFFIWMKDPIKLSG